MNTCTGPKQRSMAKPQGPGKQPRPSGKPATLLSSAGPMGSTRGSPGPSVSRVGGGLQAFLCLRLGKDRGPRPPACGLARGPDSLYKGHPKPKRLPMALALLA